MNLSRNQFALGIALLIIAGSLVFVYLRIEDRVDDPLKQRAFSEAVLKQHAEVLSRYRSQFGGAWPADRKELTKYSKSLGPELRLGFGSNAAAGGGVYRYQRPADGADERTVIMASPKAHAAIAAGTPLTDGPAAADIPAAYFVLRADLSIDQLSADQHRQQAGFLYAGSAEPAEDATDNDGAASVLETSQQATVP